MHEPPLNIVQRPTPRENRKWNSFFCLCVYKEILVLKVELKEEKNGKKETDWLPAGVVVADVAPVTVSKTSPLGQFLRFKV
jgi:hypothetical protein